MICSHIFSKSHTDSVHYSTKSLHDGSTRPRATYMVFWYFFFFEGDCDLTYTANRLGVSPSYETLRTHRKEVAERNISTPMHSGSLLFQPAWDTIDSQKVENNPRVVGENLDFHGTIVTVSQTPETWRLKPADIIHQFQNSIIRNRLTCHTAHAFLITIHRDALKR